MIDPIFRNINSLFVLSFKNPGNGLWRNSDDKYYIPLVEIKECNVLINNKTFFDQPIKTNKKYTKKLVEMTRNDEDAT